MLTGVKSINEKIKNSFIKKNDKNIVGKQMEEWQLTSYNNEETMVVD